MRVLSYICVHYIRNLMPSILNTAQYLPSILIKGVYVTLFILTQDAYLHTPAFSYAQYIPYSSVLHAYIKTFISCIHLCFTQCHEMSNS